MTAIAYLTRRTYSSPGYVRRYAVASADVIKDELGLTASFATISEPVAHFYLQIDGGEGCDFPLPRPIIPADAPLAFHNPAGWQIDLRPATITDEDVAAITAAATVLQRAVGIIGSA